MRAQESVEPVTRAMEIGRRMTVTYPGKSSRILRALGVAISMHRVRGGWEVASLRSQSPLGCPGKLLGRLASRNVARLMAPTL